MSVSLEKIDMLMERANISYKEAKDALEKHNGDMVEALIYLEAAQKTNSTQKKQAPKQNQAPRRDFMDDISAFFKKMHKTSFIISKNSHKFIDLPLTIASIIILFTLPFSIIALLVPVLLGYKINIIDEKGKKVNMNVPFNGQPQQKPAEKPEESQEDRRF